MVGPETDKALAEVVRDLAPDTLPKVKKCLGTSLDIVHRVLRGGEFLLCDSVQYVFQKVADRVSKHGDEDIIPVVPEIGGEIMQRLPLVSSNILRNLYAELLAKASIKGEVDKVHPAFVESLKKLSSDEVKIVDYMVKTDLESFPFIVPVFPSQAGAGAKTGDTALWFLPELQDQLDYPDNVFLYLDNLEAMGILKRHDKAYRDEDELCFDELNTLIRKSTEEGKFDHLKKTHKVDSVRLNKGFYGLSSFGQRFIGSLR